MSAFTLTDTIRFRTSSSDDAQALSSVRILGFDFRFTTSRTERFVNDGLNCRIPGESEEMFQETLETLRQVGFAAVHIFPYSRRQGTPAADFPNQVSESDKKERVHRAELVVREGASIYRRGFIGSNVNVLVEGRAKNGRFEGMSAHYHRVQLVNEVPNTGEIYSTHIIGEDGDGLIGIADVKEEE